MNEPQLLLAVDDGDFAAVRALLAGGADVNEKCRSGQSALMVAAAHGDLEAVRLLLRAGARVNERRGDGMTALIHAAFFGHEAVVRTLLDGGADLKARDWIGMTALDWARAQGAMNVADFLAAAESQPARPKSVRRSAAVEAENTSGEVLGLPAPGSSAHDVVDPADDVLDLTNVRRPHISDVPAHAMSFRQDTPQVTFQKLPTEAARTATTRLQEISAGIYGGIGGDYLNGTPASSYKYVGFFFALVFGTALCLCVLLLRL